MYTSFGVKKEINLVKMFYGNVICRRSTNHSKPYL